MDADGDPPDPLRAAGNAGHECSYWWDDASGDIIEPAATTAHVRKFISCPAGTFYFSRLDGSRLASCSAVMSSHLDVLAPIANGCVRQGCGWLG